MLPYLGRQGSMRDAIQIRGGLGVEVLQSFGFRRIQSAVRSAFERRHQ
jgi:hypothetical protein